MRIGGGAPALPSAPMNFVEVLTGAMRTSENAPTKLSEKSRRHLLRSLAERQEGLFQAYVMLRISAKLALESC
jgi:hypothetical protein